MSKVEYSKEEKCKKYDLKDFYTGNKAACSEPVHFDACELCKSTSVNTNLNDVSRLLNAKVRLLNVCPGKEVTVGCIVMDKCGKILAYKSETFIAGGCAPYATEDNLLDGSTSDCCYCNPCIDVERSFNFILPVSNVCLPMDVKVKVIAHYTSPCD